GSVRGRHPPRALPRRRPAAQRGARTRPPQLLRPPCRMRFPSVETRQRHRRRRLERRVVRSPRLVDEALHSLLAETLEPLVRGLSAHPILAAQLRNGQLLREHLHDQLFANAHDRPRFPRHRPSDARKARRLSPMSWRDSVTMSWHRTRRFSTTALHSHRRWKALRVPYRQSYSLQACTGGIE